MNRIIVRLRSNVSLAGVRDLEFKDETEGFWLNVNSKTNIKYYVPYSEIDEIIEKGEHTKYNESK